MEDKRIKYVPNHILTRPCVFVYRRVISLIISNSSSKSTASGSALWSRKNLTRCLGYQPAQIFNSSWDFVVRFGRVICGITLAPESCTLQASSNSAGVVRQHGKGAGEGFKRSSSNESKRLARACKGGRRAWREKERHERVKKDSFVPVKMGDVEGRGLLC
jgi:hypothetical protein